MRQADVDADDRRFHRPTRLPLPSSDEQPALRFDVADLWNVLEYDFFFGEDRRGHAGQTPSSSRPICEPFRPADSRRE